MVYIILGDGFEETEAIAPCDILRRGSVEVSFAGVSGKTVKGAHGIVVEADTTVKKIDLNKCEMIVIPGGLGGVEAIENSKTAMEIIAEAGTKGIELAAICAGPRVLAKLGLLNGKLAVCYPGMEDQMTGGKMVAYTNAIHAPGITTGRAPGAAMDFGFKLLVLLKGNQVAGEVAQAMHYVL